jgi:hypothetical protein
MRIKMCLAFLLSLPAFSEILQLDLTIFGMD